MHRKLVGNIGNLWNFLFFPISEPAEAVARLQTQIAAEHERSSPSPSSPSAASVFAVNTLTRQTKVAPRLSPNTKKKLVKAGMSSGAFYGSLPTQLNILSDEEEAAQPVREPSRAPRRAPRRKSTTIGAGIKRAAAGKKVKKTKKYDSGKSSSSEDGRDLADLLGQSKCGKCEQAFPILGDPGKVLERYRCWNCPLLYHRECLPDDVQQQLEVGVSWWHIKWECPACPPSKK